MALASECLNSRSSGSKSQTELPLSTLPGAGIAPALCNKASARVVLPAAPCPTRAIVRIACVAYFGMVGLPTGGCAAFQYREAPQWLQAGQRPILRCINPVLTPFPGHPRL